MAEASDAAIEKQLNPQSLKAISRFLEEIFRYRAHKKAPLGVILREAWFSVRPEADGLSHWIPREAPKELNRLILEFIADTRQARQQATDTSNP